MPELVENHDVLFPRLPQAGWFGETYELARHERINRRSRQELGGLHSVTAFPVLAF
jgi:hypothetical protein